jgi:hypothetical protein
VNVVVELTSLRRAAAAALVAPFRVGGEPGAVQTHAASAKVLQSGAEKLVAVFDAQMRVPPVVGGVHVVAGATGVQLQPAPGVQAWFAVSVNDTFWDVPFVPGVGIAVIPLTFRVYVAEVTADGVGVVVASGAAHTRALALWPDRLTARAARL